MDMRCSPPRTLELSGNEAYSWLDDLLRTADIAMYHEGRGKSRYEVFDSAMNDQAFTRLQLENGRQAIVRQEFRVDYQPIVLLKTGIVIGFEALLRWEHPLRPYFSRGVHPRKKPD